MKLAQIAVAATMAGAAALSAQPANRMTPAPVTATVSAPAATMSGPSLISDTSISNMDSPLVRAAKMTAAHRAREAARSTGVVINDAYMRAHPGGKVSESFSAVSYPSLGPDPSQLQAASPIAVAHIITVDRAAIERQQQNLLREQGRAAAEMGEPYGGNNGMEEDHAEQRSTEIPQQMNQNQQQLNSSRP